MTGAANGKTVLVVEDDTATREALALILKDQGFTVMVAANGQEALERLRDAPRPDVIVLDLLMPIMDGWQFRREQGRSANLSSIPVVILSADGSVEQKAASLRAAAFLQKPVEPEQLLAVVRQHAG